MVNFTNIFHADCTPYKILEHHLLAVIESSSLFSIDRDFFLKSDKKPVKIVCVIDLTPSLTSANTLVHVCFAHAYVTFPSVLIVIRSRFSSLPVATTSGLSRTPLKYITTRIFSGQDLTNSYILSRTL